MPIPSTIEALVFDFDGTLAELCIDFKAMKDRLAALAREYLNGTLASSSLPALEWLDLLMARVAEADRRAAKEFMQRAQALIVDIELEAARRGKLFPFTRSLLDELVSRQVKVAIITRNCEAAVRIVFPDIDHYCTGFLARNHVPRVKPDPEHLFQALTRIKAAPDRALMVGDHPLDIQTGKSAGVLTAGVWSGNSSREDLARSGAHWTAPNCRELIEILTAQGCLQRPSEKGDSRP